MRCPSTFLFFFFNDTATTEIYTLSLHDALPIWVRDHAGFERKLYVIRKLFEKAVAALDIPENKFAYIPSLSSNTLIYRSEEHTSELQSRLHLVCRLLLEKKKKHITKHIRHKLST